MTDLDVWIEGVSSPFTLRFHDVVGARAMAAIISLAASENNPEAAPFKDDTGTELSFVLSALRAIHLQRDI